MSTRTDLISSADRAILAEHGYEVLDGDQPSPEKAKNQQPTTLELIQIIKEMTLSASSETLDDLKGLVATLPANTETDAVQQMYIAVRAMANTGVLNPHLPSLIEAAEHSLQTSAQRQLTF